MTRSYPRNLADSPLALPSVLLPNVMIVPTLSHIHDRQKVYPAPHRQVNGSNINRFTCPVEHSNVPNTVAITHSTKDHNEG